MQDVKYAIPKGVRTHGLRTADLDHGDVFHQPNIQSTHSLLHKLALLIQQLIHMHNIHVLTVYQAMCKTQKDHSSLKEPFSYVSDYQRLINMLTAILFD